MGKLVACRQCGGMVSIYASTCQTCGASGMAVFGPITCVVFVAIIAVALLAFGAIVVLVT